MSLRELPFACCVHCGCPIGDRIGHDDSCRFRCNDTPSERDDARIRAELRDRLDRCTDHDHGLAFGWLADNHADLVREALDETGAPS